MPDNNLIEQDHRSIKLRLGPMLGLKRFRSASITIAASNSLIGSGRVSSNSESFALKTKRRPQFGMQFSHQPADIKSAGALASEIRIWHVCFSLRLCHSVPNNAM
jgi:hypothetical protein